MGEADVVRDGGRRGARTTGERCGMVIDRAAETGLSRCGEHVRAAAAASPTFCTPSGEFEQSCNGHRPHQGIANARPLQPLPVPLVTPDQIASLAWMV